MRLAALAATETCAMLGSCDPRQNRLLAALTPAESSRIFPYLKLASLRLGEVLYEPGARFDHVWFPATCIVSLLLTLKDGASAEIAMVGNEGLIGVAF
jgi:hypothetical protein